MLWKMLVAIVSLALAWCMAFRETYGMDFLSALWAAATILWGVAFIKWQIDKWYRTPSRSASRHTKAMTEFSRLVELHTEAHEALYREGSRLGEINVVVCGRPEGGVSTIFGGDPEAPVRDPSRSSSKGT